MDEYNGIGMSTTTTVTTKDRAMDMEIQQVPWWNRRTRMERRFFILSITLLLTTIGLSIALVGVLYTDIISPSRRDNTVRVDYVRSDSGDVDSFQTTFTPSKQTLKVVNEIELGAGKRVTRLIVHDNIDNIKLLNIYIYIYIYIYKT